jgi:two-component system sensor histidine kinase KdpD
VVWLGLLLVAVLVLRPLRSDANVGVIALVMLLPPLVATGSGRLVAALVALASGLVFNFFFTHPYDSPRIASRVSVTAFVVYVVVGVSLAVLGSRLRDASGAATQRAREATLLQRLTVDLISAERLDGVISEALGGLVDALALRSAGVDVTVGQHTIRVASGGAGRGERERFAIATIDESFGFLEVEHDGPLGESAERVINSFAGIVALAIARVRLADEAALRSALENTDRLRTILLQSVSHDLRTPLTAIKAAAGALRVVPPSAEIAATILTDIEDHADRLTHLVANLLDLSRIESGALHLERQVVPVDELIAGAVDAARSALDGPTVVVEVAEPMPSVEVDETMIRQVIVNLLQNAARHDPDGPILVSARAAADCVEVTVSDHGPGVAKETVSQLFVPFANRHGRSGTQRTGVGLAIARGFVTAHGGTIRYVPAAAGGASFTITLPVPA